MAGAEAQKFIKIANDASEKVDRTQFKSLNSVLQAAEKHAGGEDVIKLATATNSLINAYARAISPSGTPTVSDKEHARDILDTAFSKGQFKAATDVMMQEIDAAKASPGTAKEALRELRGQGGKSDHSSTNGKGWKLHTDKNGNKAYVSPDGKQFEEVK
jgi:hypothetical protein